MEDTNTATVDMQPSQPPARPIKATRRSRAPLSGQSDQSSSSFPAAFNFSAPMQINFPRPAQVALFVEADTSQEAPKFAAMPESVESGNGEENAVVEDSLSESDELLEEPYRSVDAEAQTDRETEEVVQNRTMAEEIQKLEINLKDAQLDIKKLQLQHEGDQEWIQTAETAATENQESLQKEKARSTKLTEEIEALKAQKKQDDAHIEYIEGELSKAQEQIDLDAKDILRFKAMDKSNKESLQAAHDLVKSYKNELFTSAMESKGVLAEGAKAAKKVTTKEKKIADLNNQISDSAHFAPDLYKHQEIIEDTFKEINNMIDDVPALSLHPEAYDAPADVAADHQRLMDELAAYSSSGISAGESNAGTSIWEEYSAADASSFLDEILAEQDFYAYHEPIFEDPNDSPLEESEDYSEENESTIDIEPATLEKVLEQAIVKEVEVEVPVVNEIESLEDISRKSSLSNRLDDLLGSPNLLPFGRSKSKSGPGAGPYEQPLERSKTPDPIIIIKEVLVPGPAPDPVIKIEKINVPGPVRLVPGPAPDPITIIQERCIHSWLHVERDFAYLLTLLYAAISAILFRWFVQPVQEVAPITADPIPQPAKPEITEDLGNETILPQAQMMAVIPPESPPSSGPTDGVAPGSDPSDAPLRPVTPPNRDFAELLPPLPASPDTREEIPAAPPASPPNPNTNTDDQTTTAPASPTTSGAPPAPASTPIEIPAPGFWDLTAARPRPSISKTLFNMLLHLIVYYFVYISFSTYQERNLWLAANDATRAYLHTILGFRYNQGDLLKLVLGTPADHIERAILLFFTQTNILPVQAFKMAG